jgi:VIT1/CCC1 family predicted Fe2+/Mn2+ transporter
VSEGAPVDPVGIAKANCDSDFGLSFCRKMTGKNIRHGESHRSERAGWLRAAVLGADDGVVSTASLMIGVAASSASKSAILIAGTAGLVAGAMSMAAGEYVSVGSQRDSEEADVRLEKRELKADPKGELRELQQIYRQRGLDPDLAMKVAEQLSRRDRLGAHLRDELGIVESSLARPLQAALVSAASFASLAIVPILTLLVVPASERIAGIAMTSLVSLAGLGALGGYVGGAPVPRAAVRVTIGGGVAMAITALIGHLLGIAAG